ncbi:hypothetical protein ES705_48601 [subsurface metagenome]
MYASSGSEQSTAFKSELLLVEEVMDSGTYTVAPAIGVEPSGANMIPPIRSPSRASLLSSLLQP